MVRLHLCIMPRLTCSYIMTLFIYQWSTVPTYMDSVFNL